MRPIRECNAPIQWPQTFALLDFTPASGEQDNGAGVIAPGSTFGYENLATGIRESAKRAAARQDWPKGWAMTVFRLGVLLLMNHRHAPHGMRTCKHAMRNAEPSI